MKADGTDELCSAQKRVDMCDIFNPDDERSDMDNDDDEDFLDNIWQIRD